MVIYKLTNLINNKVYIGQTKDFEKRIQQHKNGAKFKHTKHYPLYKAINKYGWDNFSKEVIDTAETQIELDQKEIYWIAHFDSCIDNGKGYNVKLGGEGGAHSEYTKKKIGEAQLGELNHMYGKKGKDNHSSKRVKNITLNITYDSVTDCAETEQVSLSHVAAVCRGERGSTNRNVYRYIDHNGNILEPESAIDMKFKTYKNLDTNEIFNSIKEIEEQYGLKNAKSNIHKVCRGTRKTAYGFRWSFAN